MRAELIAIHLVAPHARTSPKAFVTSTDPLASALPEPGVYFSAAPGSHRRLAPDTRRRHYFLCNGQSGRRQQCESAQVCGSIPPDAHARGLVVYRKRHISVELLLKAVLEGAFGDASRVVFGAVRLLH